MGLRICFASIMAISAIQHAECEPMTGSSLTFEGSLPFQYSSNSSRASSNPKPDGSLSPYLKLSSFGPFGPDLTYSVYASGGLDRYFQFADGNGSVAALGGQLLKDLGNLRLGFIFERALYFEEYFRRSDAVANDLGASARTSLSSETLGLTARPMLSASARFDDHENLQRTLLSARLVFEKKLTADWALLLASQARLYRYEGTRSGRLDTIYSFNAGIRYDVSRNVSWTTSVIYESRDSNTPRNDYSNYIVSTSIDFSFDLPGPRHPQ